MHWTFYAGIDTHICTNIHTLTCIHTQTHTCVYVTIIIIDGNEFEGSMEHGNYVGGGRKSKMMLGWSTYIQLSRNKNQ